MPTEISGTTGVSQIQAGATSNGLPVFQCRAWVNFDGTRDSTGAVSTANTARFIRASGNVTSVVRNGNGDYTVNFATAMPDANYCVDGSSSVGALGTPETRGGVLTVLQAATNSVRVLTPQNSDNGATPVYRDYSMNSVAIFR